MKPETQHTPTPIKADLAVKPDDGYVIELTANDGAETVGYATSGANAEFIVRAVNSHEELLNVVRKFRDEIPDWTTAVNDTERLEKLFSLCNQAIARAEGR